MSLYFIVIFLVQGYSLTQLIYMYFVLSIINYGIFVIIIIVPKIVCEFSFKNIDVEARIVQHQDSKQKYTDIDKFNTVQIVSDILFSLSHVSVTNASVHEKHDKDKTSSIVDSTQSDSETSSTSSYAFGPFSRGKHVPYSTYTSESNDQVKRKRSSPKNSNMVPLLLWGVDLQDYNIHSDKSSFLQGKTKSETFAENKSCEEHIHGLVSVADFRTFTFFSQRQLNPKLQTYSAPTKASERSDALHSLSRKNSKALIFRLILCTEVTKLVTSESYTNYQDSIIERKILKSITVDAALGPFVAHIDWDFIGRVCKSLPNLQYQKNDQNSNRPGNLGETNRTSANLEDPHPKIPKPSVSHFLLTIPFVCITLQPPPAFVSSVHKKSQNEKDDSHREGAEDSDSKNVLTEKCLHHATKRKDVGIRFHRELDQDTILPLTLCIQHVVIEYHELQNFRNSEESKSVYTANNEDQGQSSGGELEQASIDTVVSCDMIFFGRDRYLEEMRLMQTQDIWEMDYSKKFRENKVNQISDTFLPLLWLRDFRFRSDHSKQCSSQGCGEYLQRFEYNLSLGHLAVHLYPQLRSFIILQLSQIFSILPEWLLNHANIDPHKLLSINGTDFPHLAVDIQDISVNTKMKDPQPTLRDFQLQLHVGNIDLVLLASGGIVPILKAPTDVNSDSAPFLDFVVNIVNINSDAYFTLLSNISNDFTEPESVNGKSMERNSEMDGNRSDGEDQSLHDVPTGLFLLPVPTMHARFQKKEDDHNIHKNSNSYRSANATLALKISSSTVVLDPKVLLSFTDLLTYVEQIMSVFGKELENVEEKESIEEKVEYLVETNRTEDKRTRKAENSGEGISNDSMSPMISGMCSKSSPRYNLPNKTLKYILEIIENGKIDIDIRSWSIAIHPGFLMQTPQIRVVSVPISSINPSYTVDLSTSRVHNRGIGLKWSMENLKVFTLRAKKEFRIGEMPCLNSKHHWIQEEILNMIALEGHFTYTFVIIPRQKKSRHLEPTFSSIQRVSSLSQLDDLVSQMNSDQVNNATINIVSSQLQITVLVHPVHIRLSNLFIEVLNGCVDQWSRAIIRLNQSLLFRNMSTTKVDHTSRFGHDFIENEGSKVCFSYSTHPVSPYSRLDLWIGAHVHLPLISIAFTLKDDDDSFTPKLSNLHLSEAFIAEIRNIKMSTIYDIAGTKVQASIQDICAFDLFSNCRDSYAYENQHLDQWSYQIQPHISAVLASNGMCNEALNLAKEDAQIPYEESEEVTNSMLPQISCGTLLEILTYLDGEAIQCLLDIAIDPCNNDHKQSQNVVKDVTTVKLKDLVKEVKYCAIRTMVMHALLANYGLEMQETRKDCFNLSTLYSALWWIHYNTALSKLSCDLSYTFCPADIMNQLNQSQNSKNWHVRPVIISSFYNSAVFEKEVCTIEPLFKVVSERERTIFTKNSEESSFAVFCCHFPSNNSSAYGVIKRLIEPPKVILSTGSIQMGINYTTLTKFILSLLCMSRNWENILRCCTVLKRSLEHDFQSNINRSPQKPIASYDKDPSIANLQISVDMKTIIIFLYFPGKLHCEEAQLLGISFCIDELNIMSKSMPSFPLFAPIYPFKAFENSGTHSRASIWSSFEDEKRKHNFTPKITDEYDQILSDLLIKCTAHLSSLCGLPDLLECGMNFHSQHILHPIELYINIIQSCKKETEHERLIHFIPLSQQYVPIHSNASILSSPWKFSFTQDQLVLFSALARCGVDFIDHCNKHRLLENSSTEKTNSDNFFHNSKEVTSKMAVKEFKPSVSEVIASIPSVSIT